MQVESVQKDAGVLSRFGLTSVTGRLDLTSRVGLCVGGSVDMQVVVSDDYGLPLFSVQDDATFVAELVMVKQAVEQVHRPVGSIFTGGVLL